MNNEGKAGRSRVHGRTTIAGLGLIGGSMALALWRMAGRRYGDRPGPPPQRRPSRPGRRMERPCPAVGRKRDGWPRPICWCAGALPRGGAVDFLCGRHGSGCRRQRWSPTFAASWAVVRECGPSAEKGLCFIGGHPMAGRGKAGGLLTRSWLFAGASYILTPE